MAKRVTIQDIADALGLSRNTVSKAINNTGVLAETTRKQVLTKAVEMGYKQFSYFKPETLEREIRLPEEAAGKTNIFLLTAKLLDNGHFASSMLKTANAMFEKQGLRLVILQVTGADIAAGQMPPTFDPATAAAIICVEIFDYDYARMICDQGIPTVFADAPVQNIIRPLPAVVLQMNNRSGIYQFMDYCLQKGRTRFGFVGNYRHCQSFYERYTAFQNAAAFYQVDADPVFSVLGEDSLPHDLYSYREYLRQELASMPSLPQVLICANDYVAIDACEVLKQLGSRVPDDVLVCGFDDSQRSRYYEPRLTTIRINGDLMGQLLADTISHLSQNQATLYTTLYADCKLLLRESSEA
jgi:LacI family transcriptional regulator